MQITSIIAWSTWRLLPSWQDPPADHLHQEGEACQRWTNEAEPVRRQEICVFKGAVLEALGQLAYLGAGRGVQVQEF